MNTLEIYVSNITVDEATKYKNIRRLVADLNCYGDKKEQTEIFIDDLQYKNIIEKGYYIG